MGSKDYNVYYEYEFSISGESSISHDYGVALPYDGNLAIPSATRHDGRLEDGDYALITRGIDPNTEQLVEVTTTISATNTVQGSRNDLLRGNVYPADAVYVGNELNGADLVALESNVLGRRQAALAVDRYVNSQDIRSNPDGYGSPVGGEPGDPNYRGGPIRAMAHPNAVNVSVEDVIKAYKDPAFREALENQLGRKFPPDFLMALREYNLVGINAHVLPVDTYGPSFASSLPTNPPGTVFSRFLDKFVGSADGSSSQKDSWSEPQVDQNGKPTGGTNHFNGDGSPAGTSFSGGTDSRDSAGDRYNSPLLLDLDGDGVEITELSKSTTFMDAGGDGLLHRTAWTGVGDGVLFFDDDGDGTISEKKEYVFTEWDPTATDDLAALRAVFDSNGDGVLDATDARFADFKVLVTNADGSTETKTLAELGITEINLTADTTRVELPDGSMITGQTTFTRTDGSTGTVANATLVAEAQGYRVEQAESTNGSGNRVVVSTAYRADGDVAYTITSVTSPDGSNTTNSYDDTGDGVVDRVQVITTVMDGSGNKTETVVNKAGSNAATAIVISRVVTTTSADGADVTIQRDSTGGGWFDQEEIRTTLPDGSRSIVIHDLAEDGSVIRGSSEVTSIDGLTRTKGTARRRRLRIWRSRWMRRATAPRCWMWRTAMAACAAG